MVGPAPIRASARATTIAGVLAGVLTTGCPPAGGETTDTDTATASGTTTTTTNGGTTTGEPTTSGTSTGTSTSTSEATGSTSDGTSEATGSTSSTGESTSSTGETTGGADGCMCIVDEEVRDGFEIPLLPTCGESVCDLVDTECDAVCSGGGELQIVDATALECALTALRERTPGIVRWTWSEFDGEFTDSGYILIFADGRAVYRSWGDEDLVFSAGDARLGELPDSDVYAACLADPSIKSRFQCLRGTMLGGEVTVCDEGWSNG